MKIDWGPENHDAKCIKTTIDIDKYRYFYTDVETDGGDPPKICSIALCPEPGIVYWFRLPNAQYGDKIKQVLESSKLGGQNVKGDVNWLCQNGYNISIDQIVTDTQLMAYVMCSTKESLALKNLVKEVLEWEYPTYKEITKGKVFRQYACEKNPSLMVPSKAKIKPGKKPRMLLPKEVLMPDQPDDVLCAYNGMDALAGHTLSEVYKGVATGYQKRYFNQIEFPVMKVCYAMERRGIKVDVPKLRKFHGEWEGLKTASHADIYRAGKSVIDKYIQKTKKPFNMNSSVQMLDVMRRLVDPKIKATNKLALEIYKDHPFVKALREFREYSKLTGTYSGPLLEKALRDSNHRIHTNFNQVAKTATAAQEKPIRTGRFSSSDPNLQNIHAQDEDEEGHADVHPIRQVFIAEDGNLLYGSDYNQIEYRLLAHDCKDPILLNAYHNGLDIHQVTAAQIWSLPYDQVTKDQRYKAKSINFAIIYGAWIKKIAEMCGMEFDEAAKFLENYKAQFPQVTEWKRRLLDQARRDGGVWTMFGRFIPIPGLRSIDDYVVGHAERQVADYRIQGSAADIMKTAMIRIYQRHKITPVLTVHDELLLDEPEHLKDEMTEMLSYEMSNVIKLDVPLIATAASGHNWADVK